MSRRPLPRVERDAFIASLAIVVALAGGLLGALLAAFGEVGEIPPAAWLVFAGPAWLLSNLLTRMRNLLNRPDTDTDGDAR